MHEAAIPAGPSALATPAGDIAADVRAMISAARDVFTSPVVCAALPGLVADVAADPELNVRVMARFTGIGGATMLRMLLWPGSDLDDEWVAQTTAIVVHGVTIG